VEKRDEELLGLIMHKFPATEAIAEWADHFETHADELSHKEFLHEANAAPIAWLVRTIWRQGACIKELEKELARRG
jgi:hypothetical protein